eukprot:jgi/Botrbrau1/10654/Bobra.53_2s0012.1
MLRSSIYQFHFQVLHQGLQPQARRRSRHVRKVCHVRAQAEDVQADIGLAPKPELKPPPSRPIPQPQQRRAAGNDVSFKKPAKGGEDERYGKRPYLTGEDRRRAGYADRKRDNGGRHNSGREGEGGTGLMEDQQPALHLWKQQRWSPPQKFHPKMGQATQGQRHHCQAAQQQTRRLKMKG